tara:strand:- start:2901 stop:3350 length:450 start_codon:yes stop_codon:yes gene_type:complete
MKVSLRRSILPDITQLHPHLRNQDLNELKALGIKPRTSLMYGYLHGECFTAMCEDTVLCMYGVIPKETGGCIWMLSRKGIEKFALPISRLAKAEIERMSKKYSMLHNIVDERNKIVLRWLKMLGFKFGSSYIIGPNKHSFKEFYLWAQL